MPFLLGGGIVWCGVLSSKLTIVRPGHAEAAVFLKLGGPGTDSVGVVLAVVGSASLRTTSRSPAFRASSDSRLPGTLKF